MIRMQISLDEEAHPRIIPPVPHQRGLTGTSLNRVHQRLALDLEEVENAGDLVHVEGRWQVGVGAAFYFRPPGLETPAWVPADLHLVDRRRGLEAQGGRDGILVERTA